MVRIRDIVEFLTERELATHVVWGTQVDRDATVRGVRSDREARVGDLSWISAKVRDSEPERIGAFAGTLLIASDQTAGMVHCVTIASPNPKLAFSLVVQEFFRDLTETRWPT